jgi:hypothetical protein
MGTGAVKKKGRLEFREMKKNGEKVAWITACDYPAALFAEAAGMDMIRGGGPFPGEEHVSPVRKDCEAEYAAMPKEFEKP